MPRVRHSSMRHLERILRVLFWLPILLGGIIAFAFIEPKFQTFGIISAGLLGVFVFVVLLQAVWDRRALDNSRNETTDVAGNLKYRPIKEDRA
jgi:4-hydroxybenzoate polyprenyltransferase